MPGSVGLYGFGPVRTRDAYFTGLNINATASSRTAITSGTGGTAGRLAVGDVLIRDPNGQDTGLGFDFTQPQTSYLHEQALVVVALKQPKVGTYSDGTNTFYPQDFVGIECSEMVSASVKANATAGVTILGLANASCALQTLGTALGLGGAGVTAASLTDSSGGTVSTTLAAQTLPTALTHAVGTADATVDDVGGAFNQTTLNNNFKEVTTTLAAIRAQLVVLQNATATLAAGVNVCFKALTLGKALAMQTADTSSTAAVKNVRLGSAQPSNI